MSGLHWVADRPDRSRSLPEKAKKTPRDARSRLKPISSSRLCKSHGELVDANESAFRASRWRRGSCRARGCRELTVDGDRGVESCSLQQRVKCEPDSRDQGTEIL